MFHPPQINNNASYLFFPSLRSGHAIPHLPNYNHLLRPLTFASSNMPAYFGDNKYAGIFFGVFTDAMPFPHNIRVHKLQTVGRILHISHKYVTLIF